MIYTDTIQAFIMLVGSLILMGFGKYSVLYLGWEIMEEVSVCPLCSIVSQFYWVIFSYPIVPLMRMLRVS